MCVGGSSEDQVSPRPRVSVSPEPFQRSNAPDSRDCAISRLECQAESMILTAPLVLINPRWIPARQPLQSLRVLLYNKNHSLGDGQACDQMERSQRKEA